MTFANPTCARERSHVRRDRPTTPPPLRHRRHDACSLTIRLQWHGGGATGQDQVGCLAPRQAGNKHVVRVTQAGRRRTSQRRIRGGWPCRRARRRPSARLAVRHLQLRRCRASACLSRLSGDSALFARLWHDALPVRRNSSIRAAIGPRRRYHCALGCAQDREGDPRRLRLGCADGQHHSGAVAGALQGDGLGERLPDRQPASRQDALAAES